MFDQDCVEEAILNAIAHNDWTITEPQISFFDDRIEIISHGGLPSDLSRENFFKGISKPKNPTLMRILSITGIVEHTGHGIPTIVRKYGEDVFRIEENMIICTIPFDERVLEKNNIDINKALIEKEEVLNDIDDRVYTLIKEGELSTVISIAMELNISKRTVERSINRLQKLNLIEKIGSKKIGKWIIK